ncbi:MAG: cation-transporting P-type ATPase [Alphaproteobacteria bacterium]|nr:cation-transporting P-type ATPase [Alphaproteobacteria bacterium]
MPLRSIVERIEDALRTDINDGDAAPASADRPWHATEIEHTLRALEAPRGGLTGEAARDRLERHGPNALPPLASRSQLAILLDQLQSSPVLLLAGAAGLSLATGGIVDAIVILGVVVLNTAIGFITERNTERIIGSLRLPSQQSALVRRDAQLSSVPLAEVVLGDLIMLRPGAIVPADGRVITADALLVDESMLTGESDAVAKRAAPVDFDNPVAERASMVYRGTTVVGGAGTAVVVATGARTEAGRIQLMVGEAAAPETPIQQQLRALGGQLALLASAVCAAVFVIGLRRGTGFVEMLRAAIALAVAAIPEGLPTLATTSLAIGVEQMRRRGVLVRRLDAIETLAAVDVIAFDKTGTLTRNEMSVSAIACAGKRYSAGDVVIRPGGAAASHPELIRLLEIIALCSDARLQRRKDRFTVSGTPTETALVQLAINAGLDVDGLRRSMPLRGAEYRSQDRQYMVTVHEPPRGGTLYAVKGSPEQVLAMCDRQLRGNRRVRLTAAARRHIQADNRAMGETGLRVLGVAYAEETGPQQPASSVVVGAGGARRLCWAGLVGLMDPVRHGADDLMSQFGRAGVRMIMMTGDQASTARAIASDLNLAEATPMIVTEPRRLQNADAQAMTDLAQRTHIFARITPTDKLRIVRALQSGGSVVAMTGDGINDSPALRAADVGIVMGRSGAEAAREVADIVLQADDLAGIATALKSGRVTYANVRKGIRFLLATNLSEILVVLAATAVGAGTLLSPIQLLWINLLSDVLPAIGLALETAEDDVMMQPPRDPREAIIRSEDMARLAREGGIIAAGSLAAYYCGTLRHGASPRAGTICFSSLVGAQLLHALTSRSDRHGLFSSEWLEPNRLLSAMLLGSAGLLAAILAVPGLRRLMGLARLDLADLLAAAAGALLPYIANEGLKLAVPGPQAGANDRVR